MTIAVDLGRKATKQTNKAIQQNANYWLRYSTTPYVTTLLVKSSHALKFAFIFFADTLT